ncbi:MAG: hypothetical protein AABX01_07255, partial [Candidatus Micrarchaeota archaeon]
MFRQFFALLILVLASASAFSEFGHLFPERQPASLIYLMLQPRDCGELAINFEPVPRNAIPTDSRDALLHYDIAMGDLEMLLKFAKYVPFSAYSMQPMSAYSVICHQGAIDAINHASASLKSLFLEIDEKAARLDLLQGDEEVFSSGMAVEKRQLEFEIANGKRDGKFVEAVLEASGNLSRFWAQFPFKTDGFLAISKILGAGGALHEAAIFSTRIGLATTELEALQLNATRGYASALFDAQEGILRLRQDKIDAIRGSDAFYLLKQGLGQNPISPISGNFYSQIKELDSEIGKARSMHTQSEKTLAAKMRGYLAHAYLLESGANGILMDAAFEENEIAREAEELENALTALMDHLGDQIKTELGLKISDPIAHEYLSGRFLEIEKRRQMSPFSAPIGERVNALAAISVEMDALLNSASASDVAAYKLAQIKGKTQTLNSLIGRARKEGIDAFDEEAAYSSLRGALAGVGYDANLFLLEGLEKSADGIKSAIEAKAKGRFAYLEGIYFEIISHKEYLDLQDRIKLENYGRFFDGERLNLLENLGELADFEAFALKKSEEFEAKKPGIISRELEASLVVREISKPTMLDVPTAFTAYVNIENRLDFFSPNVRVRLPLPESATLANASRGISLLRENGALYLNIREKMDRYFAILEYSQIANEAGLDKTEFESVEFEKISLVRTIAFTTTKYSHAIIAIDAPSESFHMSYSGEYSQEIADGKINMVLEAYPGKNKLAIRFEIPSPFTVKEAAGRGDSTSQEIGFEFANTAIDVPFSGIALDR